MSSLPASGPHRHVLCGVETGELSLPAVAEAARVADSAGARFTLMHVSGTVAPFTGGRTSHGHSPQELQAALISEVHSWLDPMAASVGADPVVIVDDDPVFAMRSWALQQGVDMIVVCPHRRGLSRLLGSFASGLVGDAPCPVLLVPAG